MKKTGLGLVVGFGVSMGLGAAGCTCTMQAGGNAAGQATPQSNGSAVAAPPAAAPAPAPTAATPQAPGLHLGPHGGPAPASTPVLHGRFPLPTGGDVPIIKGGNDFGNDQQTPDSIRGLLYFLPEGTAKLPDLGAMKPEGAFFTKQINIPERDFKAGFPGVNDRFEWFAVRYAGKFNVSKPGDYGFHVRSDDGSIVWVDGTKVLDNDGTHSARDGNGKVTLTPGAHDIQVDYFQGPRYRIALVLWVTPPGGQEQLWSTSL